MDAHAPSPAAAAKPALSLRLVARPGDGLGFRLAGVDTVEVAPGEEAARFREILADPAVGVLAVEGEVLRQVPEAVLRRAASHDLPVILPFALPRSYGEPGRGREYVAALIRRAIGYHIKLGQEAGR